MYSLSKAIAWFCVCLAIIGGAGSLLVPPALALLLGAGVGMLIAWAAWDLRNGGRG